MSMINFNPVAPPVMPPVGGPMPNDPAGAPIMSRPMTPPAPMSGAPGSISGGLLSHLGTPPMAAPAPVMAPRPEIAPGFAAGGAFGDARRPFSGRPF